MDPLQESPFRACSGSSRMVRTPHQTNLILTVLAGTGNSGLLTVSGLTGVCNEKGPLIAGFSLFSSHFHEIDPFDRNHWIR